METRFHQSYRPPLAINIVNIEISKKSVENIKSSTKQTKAEINLLRKRINRFCCIVGVEQGQGICTRFRTASDILLLKIYCLVCKASQVHSKA